MSGGIIDVHAHTTEHRLWGLHTERATLDELERLATLHGVERVALMATYFPLKRSGLHNRELLRRIKGRQTFLAFGSLDVTGDLPAGLRELEELLEAREIVGIKLYPGYQAFRCDDRERAFPVYALARRFGVPVMVHTGELHHCCPRSAREAGQPRCGQPCQLDRLGHLSEPRQLIPAARAFPEVAFVLSHLGNPFFDQLRRAMALCPKVMTDLSGQFLSGTEEDSPAYREAIKGELSAVLELEGGVDRLLFGTDFPIQSYEDSIALVRSLGLTSEEEEKIFRKNAEALLRLSER